MERKHNHQWQKFKAEAGDSMSAGYQYLMRVSYYCTVTGCGRVKVATQSASTSEWRETLLHEIAVVDEDGEIGEAGAVIATCYHYFRDDDALLLPADGYSDGGAAYTPEEME